MLDCFVAVHNNRCLLWRHHSTFLQIVILFSSEVRKLIKFLNDDIPEMPPSSFTFSMKFGLILVSVMLGVSIVVEIVIFVYDVAYPYNYYCFLFFSIL